MLLLDLQSYGTGLGDEQGEGRPVRATGMGHSKNVNQQGIFVYKDKTTISLANATNHCFTW